MKKEYEPARIEFIITKDGEDVVTASGPSGAFGGEGEDNGGWT
jgi:hypothetical protein